MAPIARYVREVHASLDGTAFFTATSLYALSLWVALAIELADPVPSIAFAILLLPFFMLPAALLVAVVAAAWAAVRHRASPIKFAACWFLVCAAGVSALQRLPPLGHDHASYEPQELALAVASWSAQLAVCAFIYAKLAGSKLSRGAVASEA